MRDTRIDTAGSVRAEGDLEFTDLVDWFFPDTDRRLVGLEVEYGLVRRDTGRSVWYGEPNGAAALLAGMLDEMGGEPILEGVSLVGLTLADGATFTLEMGDALEYSSAPAASIVEALSVARQRFQEVARIAAPLGISVLTGGRLPFEDPRNITWAPKPRTDIMRKHFDSLGAGGELGDNVMGLTLSTQVSFDALSRKEYFAKLRTLVLASPFIAALVVNTPDLRAEDSPASQRMLYWRQIDPARCQELSSRLQTTDSFEELASALADLSMIYRKMGDGYVAGPPYSFRESLKRGFEDGSMPSLADWKSHLGQVWPSVRPRHTLETRLPDGQAWEHFDTLPAFFVGLIEDDQACSKALDLLAPITPSALDQLTVAVAGGGVSALPEQMRQYARDLVELACDGLRRVAPTLVSAMDPVREIAATGETPSRSLARRWRAEWRQDPASYVSAMAVPTD
jgi:glutamate--cysteine ligase